MELCELRRESDVQGVDDARNVTKDGQQDVDEEVGAAATLEEDTKRRQDDGKNDLDDVAITTQSAPSLFVLRGIRRKQQEQHSRSSERHVGGGLSSKTKVECECEKCGL